MKVRELVALLQEFDPERIVILQEDAEGNGFSPLEQVWGAVYVADSTWSGEVHPDPADDDAELCVVLRPVN